MFLHLLRIFLVDVEVKVENCIEAIKPRHAPDDMEVTYIETAESGSATSCEKEQDSECDECIHTYNGRPAVSASATPISYDINSVQSSASYYFAAGGLSGPQGRSSGNSTDICNKSSAETEETQKSRSFIDVSDSAHPSDGIMSQKEGYDNKCAAGEDLNFSDYLDESCYGGDGNGEMSYHSDSDVFLDSINKSEVNSKVRQKSLCNQSKVRRSSHSGVFIYGGGSPDTKDWQGEVVDFTGRVGSHSVGFPETQNNNSDGFVEKVCNKDLQDSLVSQDRDSADFIDDSAETHETRDISLIDDGCDFQNSGQKQYSTCGDATERECSHEFIDEGDSHNMSQDTDSYNTRPVDFIDNLPDDFIDVSHLQSTHQSTTLQNRDIGSHDNPVDSTKISDNLSGDSVDVSRYQSTHQSRTIQDNDIGNHDNPVDSTKISDHLPGDIVDDNRHQSTHQSKTIQDSDIGSHDNLVDSTEISVSDAINNSYNHIACDPVISQNVDFASDFTKGPDDFAMQRGNDCDSLVETDVTPLESHSQDTGSGITSERAKDPNAATITGELDNSIVNLQDCNAMNGSEETSDLGTEHVSKGKSDIGRE